MLKIYNSLTRKKELFKPIDEQHVRMYVCGMTVYDLCHIGHARTVTVFDVVARYLRVKGYNLTYVRNITDIDDKIIHRALEQGESIQALTDRMIKAMHEDFAKLGNLPPDKEPKATEFVSKMQAMISELINLDFAYVANNGDVYFRVEKSVDYGKLSNKSLDQLETCVRVEANSHKKNSQDFVLWKSAKPDEPHWESPWGNGRPGWHIECSAMGKYCLGDTFDIHGGGLDLQFPHHENEIAQSEACNQVPFVNFWMHSGAIRVDNVKMSKSLGNFFTIRDVLKEYNSEVVRYYLISSHYRSPMNFSKDNLNIAYTGLQRLYNALRGLVLPQFIDRESELEQQFFAAMDDDFNTPVAISVLFDLVRQINCLKSNDIVKASELGFLLRKLGGVLGILQTDADQFLTEDDKIDENWVNLMVQKRTIAKQTKQFVECDRIRDELMNHGVILQDNSDGTTSWRLK